MNKITITILTLLLTTSCVAQESKKQVMLLGVYHFNNPGLDTHNMTVDDYFSDGRQKEIEEVVTKLKAFKPTKILVEFQPKTQPKLNKIYAQYNSGEIQLKEIPGGKNEAYQLGFRLAKQLNLSAPIAIDYPGYWLGDYVDFIADTLEYDSYTSSQTKRGRYIAERAKDFRQNSILENLSSLNEWGRDHEES